MGNLMGEGTSTRTDGTTTSHEMQPAEPANDLPIVYNLKSILTKTGIPLFTNIGLSAFCLILMLACLGESGRDVQTFWDVIMYISAVVITLILLIAILFLIIVRRFFGLTPLFHGFMIAICVVGIILVVVGSIATAANIHKVYGREYCLCYYSYCENPYTPACYPHWEGDIATAAAVFGFLSAIGIIVQIVFHVRDLRSNAYSNNNNNLA